MHGETNSQDGAKKTTIMTLIVNNSILCGFCKIGYESEKAFKDHITSLREKIDNSLNVCNKILYDV